MTKYKPNTFVLVPSKYQLLKVDAIAQSVFMWLCSYTRGETGECFPSINTLAKNCRVSKNTVKDRIKKLEKIGLIEKTVRKGNNGRNMSNLYKIIINDWTPDQDEKGRSTNASYRRLADWIEDHELATN